MNFSISINFNNSDIFKCIFLSDKIYFISSFVFEIFTPNAVQENKSIIIKKFKKLKIQKTKQKQKQKQAKIFTPPQKKKQKKTRILCRKILWGIFTITKIHAIFLNMGIKKVKMKFLMQIQLLLLPLS